MLFSLKSNFPPIFRYGSEFSERFISLQSVVLEIFSCSSSILVVRYLSWFSVIIYFLPFCVSILNRFSMTLILTLWNHLITNIVWCVHFGYLAELLSLSGFQSGSCCIVLLSAWERFFVISVFQIVSRSTQSIITFWISYIISSETSTSNEFATFSITWVIRWFKTLSLSWFSVIIVLSFMSSLKFLNLNNSPLEDLFVHHINTYKTIWK